MAIRGSKNTVESTETADVEAVEGTDIPAEDVAEAPKPVRQKREPKAVTDIVSAQAAFKRAARVSAKADTAAKEATAHAELARTKLAESAAALKGFLSEVDAAVSAVVPAEAV